jgi:serine/threonine protein kinase
MLHRQMSALGTSSYAAPEIVQGVHRVDDNRNNYHKVATTHTATTETTDDITNTISSFVSDYGLLVDAYSLGCTIRYMMTGCPPHQNVADAIAKQNSFWTRVLEHCCGGGAQPSSSSSSSSSGNPRKPRFRLVEDLPGEVQRLIRKLTEPKESQRASVRSLKRYPWIQELLQPLDDDNDNDKNGNSYIFSDGPESIQYLPFAIHHQNNTPNTTNTTSSNSTITTTTITDAKQPEPEQPLVSPLST